MLGFKKGRGEAKTSFVFNASEFFMTILIYHLILRFFSVPSPYQFSYYIKFPDGQELKSEIGI